MTLRVEFDSNIFDKFLITDCALNDALIEQVNQCIGDGKLIVLVTHVQEDELSATPEPIKRESLLRVLRKLQVTKLLTSGAIWDVSRWDECTWDNGSGPIKLEHIQKGNSRHAEDALIAATASSGADVLVTQESEKKPLRKRIRAQKTSLRVWTFEEFNEFVQQSLTGLGA